MKTLFKSLTTVVCTLFLVGCLSAIADNSFKSVRMYSQDKTVHFDTLIPVDMPDFTLPPYDYEKLVPLSDVVGIMVFRNTNDEADAFGLGIIFDSVTSNMIAIALFASKTDTFYIFEKLGGPPRVATEQELEAHIDNYVQNNGKTS